jgi:hypothetical protein
MRLRWATETFAFKFNTLKFAPAVPNGYDRSDAYYAGEFQSPVFGFLYSYEHVLLNAIV